jgi:hypothetical protein
MLETARIDERIFGRIREGLASLRRANNHVPGEAVDPREVYTPASHRNALDPERTLVVGNRGMGKSFWAHALMDTSIRRLTAAYYGQPQLASMQVVVGFNGSELSGDVAPPNSVISQALKSGADAEAVWRAVIVRAASRFAPTSSMTVPASFVDLCHWVQSDAERYTNLLTLLDAALSKANERLLIVFDALDLLGANWSEKQQLTKALLSRALSARSYRAIRLKLFMRPDQYIDPNLFTFPDASKIRNDRVNLAWSNQELFGLLFHRLQLSDVCKQEFQELVSALGIVPRRRSAVGDLDIRDENDQQAIVNRIAGPFMGANAKRGRVYTWLPTHLGDAGGETSPRTFLTAWQVAANHHPAPSATAVDHVGLSEGVRRASEDRLSELQQDYPWIQLVLHPLAGESVPMEWANLEAIWHSDSTAQKVSEECRRNGWLPPIFFENTSIASKELALRYTLQVVGVVEVRGNEKINVPDIFRVEARIKRRGGVKPPKGRAVQ